ncbi:hypothetical protein NKH77_00615 [Streptomyces sp. M19]
MPLALVPQAVLLAVSLVKPLYVERYVLYSSAGLALLLVPRFRPPVAAGSWCARLRRRQRPWWRGRSWFR